MEKPHVRGEVQLEISIRLELRHLSYFRQPILRRSRPLPRIGPQDLPSGNCSLPLLACLCPQRPSPQLWRHHVADYQSRRLGPWSSCFLASSFVRCNTFYASSCVVGRCAAMCYYMKLHEQTNKQTNSLLKNMGSDRRSLIECQVACLVN